MNEPIDTEDRSKQFDQDHSCYPPLDTELQKLRSEWVSREDYKALLEFAEGFLHCKEDCKCSGRLGIRKFSALLDGPEDPDLVRETTLSEYDELLAQQQAERDRILGRKSK